MSKILWDEPTECTSPRGWASIAGQHPDNGNVRHEPSKVCGWYLDYTGCQSQGPAGETVLASAYMFRVSKIGVSAMDRLGCPWFFTVRDAKAWIERAVANHLESIAIENALAGAL